MGLAEAELRKSVALDKKWLLGIPGDPALRKLRAQASGHAWKSVQRAL